VFFPPSSFEREEREDKRRRKKKAKEIREFSLVLEHLFFSPPLIVAQAFSILFQKNAFPEQGPNLNSPPHGFKNLSPRGIFPPTTKYKLRSVRKGKKMVLGA